MSPIYSPAIASQIPISRSSQSKMCLYSCAASLLGLSGSMKQFKKQKKESAKKAKQQAKQNKKSAKVYRQKEKDHAKFIAKVNEFVPTPSTESDPSPLTQVSPRPASEHVIGPRRRRLQNSSEISDMALPPPFIPTPIRPKQKRRH